MKVKEAAQYPVLKVKLGTPDDRAILTAIRETTPKEIRVDANAGWTRKQAIRSLPMLEEFGVTVLEQPLAAEDLEGLAEVTRHSRIPVVADESCLVATDIPRLVGKVDGINIKLAKTGSLREALRMIAVARAHHMMVMVGCMIESSIGITAAAQVTPLVDICDLDGAALLARDPYVGATIDNGQLKLSEAPGLGLSVR
jgi:L-alanine-DL-glutamate epimerase-like enolase superfamily enzyme